MALKNSEELIRICVQFLTLEKELLRTLTSTADLIENDQERAALKGAISLLLRQIQACTGEILTTNIMEDSFAVLEQAKAIREADSMDQFLRNLRDDQATIADKFFKNSVLTKHAAELLKAAGESRDKTTH